jgi:hypothetical protein
VTGRVRLDCVNSTGSVTGRHSRWHPTRVGPTLELGALTFTGKLDTVTSAEIHGRCHHVVAASTGAFAGASGVISFHDDVATGTAPYRGHVTLT